MNPLLSGKRISYVCMSKTHRSTLDFFILALMADDVAVTPYTLLQRLGISPGASIPALRRLEKEGLTQRGKAGKRGRQPFKLTESGQEVLGRELHEGLPKLVQMPPQDPETLCRIVALARSGHAGIGTAIDIVEAALAKSLENARLAKESLQPMQVQSSMADIYMWASGNMEVARWKAQAVAIRRIYHSLCTKGYRINKGRRPERRKTRNTNLRPPSRN